VAGCTPDRLFAVSYATSIMVDGEPLPPSEGSFVMLRNIVEGREVQPRELAQMVHACREDLQLISGRIDFSLPALNELVGRLRFLDNRLAIKDLAPDAARELLVVARREYAAFETRLTGSVSFTAVSLLIGSSEVE